VAVAAVTVVLDEQTHRRLTRTARSARAPARDVLRAKLTLSIRQCADSTSSADVTEAAAMTAAGIVEASPTNVRNAVQS
jgi:hypothetical protein